MQTGLLDCGGVARAVHALCTRCARAVRKVGHFGVATFDVHSVGVKVGTLARGAKFPPIFPSSPPLFPFSSLLTTADSLTSGAIEGYRSTVLSSTLEAPRLGVKDSQASVWLTHCHYRTSGLSRDGTMKHDYPSNEWFPGPLDSKWNQARANYSTYDQEFLAGMLVPSSQSWS